MLTLPVSLTVIITWWLSGAALQFGLMHVQSLIVYINSTNTTASSELDLSLLHLSNLPSSFWNFWKIQSGKVSIMPWLSQNSWIQLAPPAPGCLPNESPTTPAVSRDCADLHFPTVPVSEKCTHRAGWHQQMFSEWNPLSHVWRVDSSHGNPSPVSRDTPTFLSPLGRIQIVIQMALSAAYRTVN